MTRLRIMLYFLCTVFAFIQCKTSQFRTGQLRNGNCYAKCLIIDKVIEMEEEYIVYTGNEGEEDVELIEKQIIIEPATTKWVKKKADRNCLSTDPNDCLVWCLVNQEAKVRTITVLADTTQSKKYTREVIKREVERIQGRSFEWKEVVCEKDLTRSLIQEIQKALVYQQFYEGEINGKLDQSTKNALRFFQKKNRLPIGQLDFETLDVLGVVVP